MSMPETFEQRIAGLGGSIQASAIRAQFGPSDLWVPVAGWSPIEEAETGTAMMAAIDIERSTDGFTPNITALLWQVHAPVQSAGAMTEGIVTTDVPVGFELISRQNGAIPVAHDGTGRWFRDEFRMTETNLGIESYARLDLYPCAIAPSTFHALQRTHTTPAGYAGSVPVTRDVEMAAQCQRICAAT